MNAQHTLDPRHSRLAIKLHDLVAAIDAVEDVGSQLDKSVLHDNVALHMTAFRFYANELQRDLEHEARR